MWTAKTNYIKVFSETCVWSYIGRRWSRMFRTNWSGELDAQFQRKFTPELFVCEYWVFHCFDSLSNHRIKQHFNFMKRWWTWLFYSEKIKRPKTVSVTRWVFQFVLITYKQLVNQCFLFWNLENLSTNLFFCARWKKLWKKLSYSKTKRFWESVGCVSLLPVAYFRIFVELWGCIWSFCLT